jgi:hypothetical protein
MSYLGDVHRSRSFEAAGGVPIQPAITTPISASIGRAIPPQATVASEPGSKWAASIDKLNAEVRAASAPAGVSRSDPGQNATRSAAEQHGSKWAASIEKVNAAVRSLSGSSGAR